MRHDSAHHNAPNAADSPANSPRHHCKSAHHLVPPSSRPTNMISIQGIARRRRFYVYSRFSTSITYSQRIIQSERMCLSVRHEGRDQFLFAEVPVIFSKATTAWAAYWTLAHGGCNNQLFRFVQQVTAPCPQYSDLPFSTHTCMISRGTVVCQPSTEKTVSAS